jgi:hypothetical protein
MKKGEIFTIFSPYYSVWTIFVHKYLTEMLEYVIVIMGIRP